MNPLTAALAVELVITLAIIVGAAVIVNVHSIASWAL
jgi:hypothetical protein